MQRFLRNLRGIAVATWGRLSFDARLWAFAVVFMAGAMAISAAPTYFTHEKWDDLRFPLVRLGFFTNPPSTPAWRTDGAGSDGVRVVAFQDNAEALEDQAFGDAQFPHGWKEGQSDVVWHIHWSLEDDTSCDARFCLETLTSNPTGDWPANTTTYCANCDSGADADNHQTCSIATIDMTGFKISAITKFRLYRNSSNVADDCNGLDAYVHELDAHFIQNTRGSISPTSR